VGRKKGSEERRRRLLCPKALGTAQRERKEEGAWESGVRDSQPPGACGGGGPAGVAAAALAVAARDGKTRT
jgi:hypothetical protein